jgi:DNA repair protein RadC
MGDTPDTIAAYYDAKIAADIRRNGDIESFYCVALSTRRKILGHYLVAHGTLDTILVHPREVFRPAIVCNAAAIVCLHNHPSGDPTPSESDIKVTRDLIRAGQTIKIELIDHLIIGACSPERPKAWISLRQLGYFYT